MAVRNPWGIHTDINGMDIELLKRSALIKVLFEPRDAAVVKSWLWASQPNAYWVYRSNIDLDDGTNPGELQRRYFAIDVNDYNSGHALGWWYAEWQASWIKPNGMEYFFAEAGPNEANDSSQRAIGYCMGYIKRCVQLGIKPAIGNHSFGLPQVVKYNGVDGWQPWVPVFAAINEANAGYSTPQAAYTVHSYAMYGDMMGSIDFAVGRYRLAPYDGPIIIGEFGYADYIKPSSTEAMMGQMRQVNGYMGADDRLMGYAWYDIRKHSDHQYNYCYADIQRMLDTADRSDPNNHKPYPTLPITVRGGGIIPVDPPPVVEGVKAVKVMYSVNQRAEPKIGATLLGKIAATQPPTYLRVKYPPVNGYVQVDGQPFWVLEENLKIIEEG